MHWGEEKCSEGVGGETRKEKIMLRKGETGDNITRKGGDWGYH